MIGSDQERPARGASRRGFAVLTFGNLALPVAALITAPLLARGLGPSDRGAVAGILAFVLLAPTLSGLGQQEASVYMHSRYGRGSAGYRGRMLIVGAGGAVGAALALLYCLQRSTWLLAVSAGAYVLAMVLLMPLRGARIAAGRFKLIAAEKWLQGILRLLSIVVLFVADQLTIETAVLSQLLSIVLGSLILLWPEPEPTGRLQSGLHQSPRLGSYGLGTWALTVGGLVLLRADQLWLSWVNAQQTLGVYVVASTIGELSLLGATAVRVSLLPELLRNGTRLAMPARRRAALMLLGGFLAVVACALALPVVVPIIFGDDFANAAEPATILVIAFLMASGAEVLVAWHGAFGTLWRAATLTWLVAAASVACLGLFSIDSPLATAWVKLGSYTALFVMSAAIVVRRQRSASPKGLA